MTPGFGHRVILVLGLLACGPSEGDELRVAVASNFAGVMRDVAARFERETGHELVLSAGSTGKHYAQIINGAPFDAFFAADAERPGRLEGSGRAVPGSRFTYAVGRLVLWSPRPGLVDASGAILHSAQFRFLAIANPDLAPYGRAARDALEQLGLWQTLQKRLVRGENVNQAFQFVHSGNAELGLVAASQIIRRGAPGSTWEVPPHLYRPIEQQAVLLRDSAAAREFMAFMRSEETLRLVEANGYLRLPVATRRIGH